MGFTTDQILTLAKAGFTAEQIAALNMSSYPQNPQPTPAAPAPIQPTQQMPIVAQPQVAAPAPTAPVAQPTAPIQPTQQMPIVAQPQVAAPAPTAPVAQPTAPAQATAPAAPEPQATVDDVLKAVTGLTSTFQQTMLQTAVQPQPKTAEDILAEIINPPTKQTITGGKQ